MKRKNAKTNWIIFLAVLLGFLLLSNFVFALKSENQSLISHIKLDDLSYKDSVGGFGESYIFFKESGKVVAGILDNAVNFDGRNAIEFADDDKYSIGKNGITVAFWMKPGNFNFIGEAEGYVHFLGKGEWNSAPNYEWSFRLYNSDSWDSVSRSKRITFYIFNLSGGLGAGSYFQDNLLENQWIHVVGVADGTDTLIYKNGILRDKDAYKPGLGGFANIVPENGNAPFRIGAMDRHSSFQGAIDDVKIFDRALSSEEIMELYNSYGNQTDNPDYHKSLFYKLRKFIFSQNFMNN
ncbi:MAG: LamG domain-containing protein [Nanoarchaeota archaeon]|nr:LamG domain-containing protein [Nanoarchaeota archaeon]